MMGIYAIINMRNNKVYVGQTVDTDLRYSEHVQKLRGGKHQNQHLQSAWNKYGKDSFIFIVLEQLDSVELLTEREQYWIDYYGGVNSSQTYNIREAGSKGHQSDETKLKISIARKGKRLSDETRHKISESQRGVCRIVTDEQKQRHQQAVKRGCNTSAEIERRRSSAKRQWQDSEFRYKMTHLWVGRHHTEATKEKQRNRAKLRCSSSDYKKLLAKANAKEVCQFDLSNNLLAIFPSVLEASRVTGITSGSIYYSCANVNCVSKSGYVWRYKRDVGDV